MSNFQNEQVAREKLEAKRDKRNERVASFCFDMAKLSFGGMGIGAVVLFFTGGEDGNPWGLGCAGLVATLMFFYAGVKLLK